MLLTANNTSIIGKILFALLASIIPIIIMLIENDNDKTAKVLFLNFLCNLFWNVVAIPDINVKTAFIIEKVSGCTLNSVNIFPLNVLIIVSPALNNPININNALNLFELIIFFIEILKSCLYSFTLLDISFCFNLLTYMSLNFVPIIVDIIVNIKHIIIGKYPFITNKYPRN